ncbi:BQ2448_5777 [Microbotryum intermedium]|uniref:BQ2448_5777 protein n=1 Tax=Microbotryum intermedium TaxID=269621 RepID=A0A238F583_9BASI|nr:BQ2448_5777 [Microbotryum intermedium]
MPRWRPLLSALRSNTGTTIRSGPAPRLQPRPTLAGEGSSRLGSIRCNCTAPTRRPTSTSSAEPSGATGPAALALLVVVAAYAVVQGRRSSPLAMHSAELESGVVAGPTPSSRSGSYKDPTTSTVFPRYIESSHNSGTRLKLVGTGVRTVSFLNVQVYTAAFYVDDKVLQRLAQIPGGWKNYSPSDLLPPFGDDQKGTGTNTSGEKLMAGLLDQADCAVVICNRALIARMKLARVTSTWSETEGGEALESLTRLKGLFPSRKLEKGAQLRLLYSSDRREIEFRIKEAKSGEEERLGNFDDRLLSRELFLSYFSDDAEISKELRKSTAQGFAGEPR